MNAGNGRQRGAAYAGYGYGTRRRLLFEAARDHIERSLAGGFFCEAIAIIESVITDRLESRLSWLTEKNIGFKNLGWLISNLRGKETDPKLRQLINELDAWRERRNGALHEMVKVEETEPDPEWRNKPSDWQRRVADLSASAENGYELLKKVYHRVADLNPRHHDRVFGYPRSEDASIRPGTMSEAGSPQKTS